jgi:hypothetical protein
LGLWLLYKFIGRFFYCARKMILEKWICKKVVENKDLLHFI